MTDFPEKRHITKAEINLLPMKQYDGPIHLCQTPEEAEAAAVKLKKEIWMASMNSISSMVKNLWTSKVDDPFSPFRSSWFKIQWTISPCKMCAGTHRDSLYHSALLSPSPTTRPLSPQLRD